MIGPNGSGKSNLYRALALLAFSARNGAVSALAHEGGLTSIGYAVDFGMPVAALETCAASVPIGLHVIELAKEFGQTHIVGREPLDEPPWQWPKR